VDRNAHEQTESNLYDLRTPTPYTMTLTAIANDCAENPITLTYTPTMSINQTLFSVTAPVTVTVNTQTVVLISFTFPDLIVTSLTRGESLVFLDPAGVDATSAASWSQCLIEVSMCRRPLLRTHLRRHTPSRFQPLQYDGFMICMTDICRQSRVPLPACR